jgi:hypothetical protein
MIGCGRNGLECKDLWGFEAAMIHKDRFRSAVRLSQAAFVERSLISAAVNVESTEERQARVTTRGKQVKTLTPANNNLNPGILSLLKRQD